MLYYFCVLTEKKWQGEVLGKCWGSLTQTLPLSQPLSTSAFQTIWGKCYIFLVFLYFCNYSAKNSCSQLLISCTRLLLSCTLLRISYIRLSNQSNTELYQPSFSSFFLCIVQNNNRWTDLLTRLRCYSFISTALFNLNGCGAWCNRAYMQLSFTLQR